MKNSSVFLTVLSFFLFGSVALAGKKAFICHKGETIRVTIDALEAHMKHGDYNYKCTSGPKAVALLRCSNSSLTVVAVSLSAGVPERKTISVGDSCSESIAFLYRKGFESTFVNSVSNGKSLITDYGFKGYGRLVD